MSKKDVTHRADIEDIVERFYGMALEDSIIGFIFTDVAKIELEHHLPIIVNFWADSLFQFHLGDSRNSDAQRYTGNPLEKHLDIHKKMPLRPGHFTRWLYLFNQAVDAAHQGVNADKMKIKAEQVAKSISAALVNAKRANMNLVLSQNPSD